MTRRLAVPYGLGAAGPLQIAAACRPDVEPIFLFNGTAAHVSAIRDLLADCGETFDLDTMTIDAAISQLQKRDVAGVVTYSDLMLPLASLIAQQLNLRWHSEATTKRLTNKWEQRSALAKAGLPCPRHALVGGTEDLRDALDLTGLPAVLKPVCGAASAMTFRVDQSSLGDVLERAWRPGGPGVYVLESELQGTAHVAADWLGDYVSVETASCGGKRFHFCVTDKPPLAPPFRETGMIAPSSLPPAAHDEVCAMVSSALDALEIDDGITHVEIKLTAEGPRVIEVNGRLGGSVAPLLRRLRSPDPVRGAIDIALDGVSALSAVDSDRFAFQYFSPVPLHARRLETAPDVAALSALAGVWAVDVHKHPGDRVDADLGTLGALCTVWAEASSLDGVRLGIDQIEEIIAASARYDLAQVQLAS